jgi:hypothetical protein
MGLTLNDIDGKYLVKSETGSGGTFTVNEDDVTEIRDGLTYRKDKKGLIWESSFSLVEDNQVRLESTVDPSHADNAIYLADEKGNPTNSMMSYNTLLDVKTVDGKIVMSGTIRNGNETIRLTLQKL